MATRTLQQPNIQQQKYKGQQQAGHNRNMSHNNPNNNRLNQYNQNQRNYQNQYQENNMNYGQQNYQQSYNQYGDQSSQNYQQSYQQDPIYQGYGQNQQLTKNNSSLVLSAQSMLLQSPQSNNMGSQQQYNNMGYNSNSNTMQSNIYGQQSQQYGNNYSMHSQQSGSINKQYAGGTPYQPYSQIQGGLQSPQTVVSQQILNTVPLSNSTIVNQQQQQQQQQMSFIPQQQTKQPGPIRFMNKSEVIQAQLNDFSSPLAQAVLGPNPSEQLKEKLLPSYAISKQPTNIQAQLGSPDIEPIIDDEGDEDENNFLNNMDKVQDMMQKSVQQMKREIEIERQEKERLERERKMRVNSAQRSSSPKSPRNQVQNPKNKLGILRVDYFHKLEPSFSQVRLSYGLYKKGEKPQIIYSTKYYEITQHLKMYLKQIYSNLVPHQDLYVYIELQAYAKSMSEAKRYWSIIPVYNELNIMIENKWKLYFYDIKYSIEDLIATPLKPSLQTNLLVKFGRQHGDFDKENAYFHTDYNIPYLLNLEMRTRDIQMKMEEEKRKQQQLEYLKEQRQIQKLTTMQDNRIINSNNLIFEIQNDINRIKNSEDPYIKNRQYRKQELPQFNNEDDFTAQQNKEFLEQQKLEIMEKQNSSASRKLRPKNWPPQVSKEELQKYKAEQQNIDLKPYYLYQMTGSHYNPSQTYLIQKTSRSSQYNQKSNKQNFDHYPHNSKTPYGMPLKFNKFYQDQDGNQQAMDNVNRNNYEQNQQNQQQQQRPQQQQQQNQNQQQQQQQPQKKQEPKKLTGIVNVMIKALALKGYQGQNPLGADKSIVGPDGVLQTIQGEDCVQQAEELTELAPGNQDLIFQEEFQVFQIDIDALRKKYNNLSQISIMIPLMGENEQEEEFCQGWTFAPLFDKTGSNIEPGQIERPLFKEPIVDKGPYDESKYQEEGHKFVFELSYSQEGGAQSAQNLNEQENNNQQQQEAKKEPMKGKVQIQIKALALTGYEQDDPLGADKYLVGPDGVLQTIEGEDCVQQSEELTEKVEGQQDLVFQENFQVFNIDIDQLRQKYQKLDQLYIMTPLMGENEQEEEFSQGWTFVPLFLDAEGTGIVQGQQQRPLFKEPIVEKAPYDEKLYQQTGNNFIFEIQYQQ